MGSVNGVSVGVVIPAAGKGVRMGGTRKQFRTLDSKPVLYWTVRLFDEHEDIDHIIIAAPEGDIEYVKGALDREGIETAYSVISGGATRQQSVYKGIQALPADVNVVLVHDAVRPFVYKHMISEVISSICKEGAAALAIPVADTLRSVDNDQFQQTIPREGVYRMQTPQGAMKDALEDAFDVAEKNNWQVTDDVDILNRAGYAVKVVEGSSLNIKITTRADWDFACLIWPAWVSVNT